MGQKAQGKSNRVLPVGSVLSRTFRDASGIEGLKQCNIPWVSVISRTLLVVILFPALACGLFIAVPSDPIDEPTFSSGNMWFVFGHCVIMLIGSLCVSLGITYSYGDQKQKWPLVNVTYFIIFSTVIITTMSIIPMSFNAFPIRFFVPPITAVGWLLMNGVLSAQYVKKRRLEFVSPQHAYGVESDDSAGTEAWVDNNNNNDNNNNDDDNDGSNNNNNNNTDNKWMTQATLTVVSVIGEEEEEEELEQQQEILATMESSKLASFEPEKVTKEVPTTMRMWLTIMAVLFIFGTYYFLCCSFFIVFARVTDNVGMQLTAGVVFVVFNWFARSYLLRAALACGGSTVNWASLHIQSYWFEVMGEVCGI